MKISVLFFGALKDLVGRSAESIDLPEGAQVRELLLYYARRAPRFEAMVPSLAIAVNQEYSGVERTLRDGDEVGLLPPVSGGSSTEKPTERAAERSAERAAEARAD
jgi:molybdopterin converting factor subunit 1